MNDDLSCYNQAVKVRDAVAAIFWGRENPFWKFGQPEGSNNSYVIADRFIAELRHSGFKIVPLDLNDEFNASIT